MTGSEQDPHYRVGRTVNELLSQSFRHVLKRRPEQPERSHARLAPMPALVVASHSSGPCALFFAMYIYLVPITPLVFLVPL